MSTLNLRDPADVGRLGSAAERLVKACEGLVRAESGLLWGVRRPTVRAWLWAIYSGFDPVLAIAKRDYGARSLDERGVGGRRDCREKALALAATAERLAIAIPRRSARPLRVSGAAA